MRPKHDAQPRTAALAALRAALSAVAAAPRTHSSASPSRVGVVDYKTGGGRKAGLSDLVLTGRLHQLPLYAELALSALGKGAELEGAYLYAIEESPESGGERARRYGAEEWAPDRAAFYKMVSASIEAVAAGKFGIKPDDGERGYCSYCDFSSICRKSHGPSRARAANT